MACYKLLREIDQEAQNLRGDTKSTQISFRTRIAGAGATIAQIRERLGFALRRCFFPEIRQLGYNSSQDDVKKATRYFAAPVPAGR